MSLLKYITPAIGLTVVSASIVYYVRTLFYQENEQDNINEVLFFCNQGIDCRNHFQNEDEKKSCPLGKNCSFLKLSRMLHYLNSAKSTIDVCMYLITVKDLATAIINAQKRGVKVRVITDEDMANGAGSQISILKQNGLKVKDQQKSTTLMHHKFTIIDEKIVMYGSLNWTMQATCGNWDNVVVTSQRDIVTSFVVEFDRMWTILE